MTLFRLTAVVFITVCAQAFAQTSFGSNSFRQTSFWSNSIIPAIPAVADESSPLTVGLRFHSDVAGSVTGVRFYKGLAIRAHTSAACGPIRERYWPVSRF